MSRHSVILPLLLGGLGVLLLAGYLQREVLLKVAVNRLLADTPLLLVDMQGLDLARSGLQLQRLDFALPARAQTLLLTDITLTWRRAGRFALPEPESLHVGQALLQAAGPGLPGSAAPTPAVADSAATTAVDVAGLLQTLRSFPLAGIDVAVLQLPGRPAPLSVVVVAAPGTFSAELNSDGLAGTLSLEQPDALAAASVLLQASSDEGLGGRLEFTLPADLPAGQVLGSGVFAVEGILQGEPFSAEGTLDLPPCPLEASAQCALRFAGAGALSAWSPAPGDPAALRIEGLELAGSGTLGLDAASLQLQLGDAAFDGSLATLGAAGYHAASDFTLSDVQLSLGAVPQGSLRLQTSGLELRTPQPWLPALDLDTGLTLAGNELAFDAALLLRDGSVATDLHAQGSVDLATASGRVSLRLAPLQLAERSSLGQRLGQWPYAWDFAVGRLGAELQLQWQQQAATPQAAAGTRVTGTVSASLDAVGGYYGSTLFRGLDSRLSADIDSTRPLPLGTPPLDISLDTLDAGLPLQDLQLRLQLDPDANAVLVESLSAGLLGGRIDLQQQRFDFAAAENALMLRFEGLRLEQLLALTGYEDVVVEGGVSGEVPLHFSAAGLDVSGGRLSAQQPGGSIRYVGTLGAGDTSLALVRQALSNYRFDALDSSIDYSPDGELLLRMQLQGYNPELENGRRVNLNLNLSDDVPALLRSLQAGRAIEDLLQELYE